MRNFLFFLGYLAVLSQIKADFAQKEQEAKSHDISNICTNQSNWALLPHPHDCHKFFVCANNTPEELTCEPNYYFDEESKRCILGSCEAINECQSWVRPVKNDCNAFDICKNGNYERHECTENHYFDTELGMCQPIETTPQHMCSCLLPQFATVENPDDCETYYTCINGKAVKQQCAYGSYFNSRLSACVVDFSGVCVTAPTISPQEVEMLETCQRLAINSDSDDDGVIFVADTEDCEKFYMCVNGRVVAKQCPMGFFFDHDSKYCEYDALGFCDEMREAAKEKEKQQEKEDTVQHEPSPLRLSPSYTHLKVGAGKDVIAASVSAGVAAELRPLQEKPVENSVEILHTADLPLMPTILNHLAESKAEVNEQIIENNEVPEYIL